MTVFTLKKETFNWRLALSFRGSVLYHRGQKLGSVKVDVVLEE